MTLMRMARMIERYILACGLLLAALAADAQEVLTPLSGNAQLIEADAQWRRNADVGSRSGDTLSLPFFDDFSEPFSRERNPIDHFPDPSKWTDRFVYVNDHMAVNPISVGVATFDGLDAQGLAYGFGLTVPTAADTLTSSPIDLSGTADVWLSFHYQAQGMGLAPASNDLLALEFKASDGLWEEVWTANGYNLENMDFRRAMIPITEEAFLFRGFQFRFVNYAALAGSVDHWHVDYVLLDAGRSEADTIYRDLALVKGTETLLSGRFSMPWTHFKSSETGYMADTRYFMLRNNFDEPRPSVYRFSIINALGETDYTFSSASVDVLPNIICGNELEDCSADNFGSALLDVRYETDVELSADSNAFLIETFLSVGGDQFEGNNRIVNKQRFYNYYAYDDGTAEVGYGLGNLQFPGQVAIRYDAVMRDSLRAIQYYLNPVGEDLSDEPVRFFVWSGDAVPEQLLYQSEEFQLDYSTGINFMNHHFLPTPLDIEGTFFIGWQQQPVQGQKFSIGFDLGRDASENVFYAIGTAPWTQSSIEGAVMFRPVFGNPYDWTVSVEEQMPGTLEVYPNPSSGIIYLREAFPGQFAHAYVHLYDVTGRAVHAQRGYSEGIDLSGVNHGLYILEVQTGNGDRFAQRIILRP